MLRFALAAAALTCVAAFVTLQEFRIGADILTAPGPEPSQAAPAPNLPTPAQAAQPPTLEIVRPPMQSGYRQASIPADAGGQYVADFLVNGQDVLGMVDTGATFVALSASTAARLGVFVDRVGPHYRVQTANGVADAWPAKISSISLGGLYVTGVDALVMDGDMPAMLIGASFLKRLISVEQTGGMLVLRQ